MHKTGENCIPKYTCANSKIAVKIYDYFADTINVLCNNVLLKEWKRCNVLRSALILINKCLDFFFLYI